MKQLLKRLLLVLPALLVIGISAPVFAGTPTGGCDTTSGSSKSQILSGAGEAGTADCSGNGVMNIASSVVSILSLVLGVVAVIMIIIAGFRYVTSAGDTGKVGSAKSTLIYALVGLVVAALAQFLVHFVLHASDKAVAATSSDLVRQAALLRLP